MAELTMADRALTARVAIQSAHAVTPEFEREMVADVLQQLRGATVFRANEIAAYVHQSTTPGDWDLGESFPGLRLPFSPLLVEFRPPGHDYHVGVLLTESPATVKDVEACGIEARDGVSRTCRLVSSFLLTEQNGEVLINLPPFFFAVAESGEVIVHWSYSSPGCEAGGFDLALDNIFQGTIPGLLAVSLANCRNTQLVEHKPNPKLAARREKKQGYPVHHHFTLQIDSLRKVKPGDLRVPSGDPTPRAQHQVRGHFADYRNGRGLFGRLRGRFWFGPSMRGSAEAGLVEKDYAVAPSPAAPGVRGA